MKSVRSDVNDFYQYLSLDSGLTIRQMTLGTYTATMIDSLLEHVHPKSLAVAIVVLLVLAKFSQWVNKERKIRALGGHAPKIRTWLPYGT